MTHKKIGTLAEIGYSEGDVFEFIEWSDGNDEAGAFAVGKAYTVNGGCLDSGSGYFWMRDALKHKWKLVSRARPQGPVITETVKRIVPGVYGKVEVTEVGNIWMQPTSNRADLIEARDVFNQIIDAMGDE